MIAPIRTVLVGVGAVEGDTVLPAGIALARNLSAELHVVHSYEVPHPVQAAYVRLGMREAAIHGMFSRKIRVRLEAEVRRLDADLPVTIHTVAEEPGLAVCNVAREQQVDLIVLGSTRQGVLQKHILGSTADRVIRGARLPVLVLKPPFKSNFQRVLVTTDLSPASSEVVRYGLELVEQLSLGDTPEVRCVLAAFYDSASPQLVPRDRLIETAKKELDSFLAQCGRAGMNIEAVVRVGDPAREVVADAAANHSDLVVLGTHGRTGVSRYFLGSVAASVLQSVTTSVLVIPHAALREPQEARSGDSPAYGS